MKNTFTLTLTLTLILLVLMLSCETTGTNYTQITKIEYGFNDSSVPPQYHRSYVITITEEKLHIVVDSYGKILAEKTIPMDRIQFNSIIADLEKFGIKTGPDRVSKGCDGGTGEELKCWAGSASVLSGYVGHCGGQDTGTLYGDVPAFAKSLIALIPDFKVLLNRE